MVQTNGSAATTTPTPTRTGIPMPKASTPRIPVPSSSTAATPSPASRIAQPRTRVTSRTLGRPPANTASKANETPKSSSPSATLRRGSPANTPVRSRTKSSPHLRGTKDVPDAPPVVPEQPVLQAATPPADAPAPPTEQIDAPAPLSTPAPKQEDAAPAPIPALPQTTQPPPKPPRDSRRAESKSLNGTEATPSRDARPPASEAISNSHDVPPPPVPTQSDSVGEVAILTSKLKALEIQYRILQNEHSRCKPRVDRAPDLPAGISADKVLEVLYDRATLGAIVHAMPKEQRISLLGVISEACRPSDIQAQIELLQKYKETRSGVLGRMDDDMCLRVIQYLNRGEILNLRLVAKRYDRLATLPAVWRPLCKELESTWDGMVNISNYGLEEDGDWFGLYKRLWQREKQWTNGQVQSLVVLNGHKNFVTSLHLAGETLISGSYDDTLRVWHLPYAVSSAKAVPPPQVIPAKSVSSLDYYAPEQIIVTGSHDVGRATIWRQVDGEWKVERLLSGHLHGTRAVAINAQWMISAGSDKAIVVWDWRNGNKVVRFGQQTNVCVGMNLLDNFVITATVDGVIRSFSIQKREMLGSFKLSDLAARQPEYAAKLKDVGVGALGMLTWFEAEGRFMACATKDIVIRLAWDWATPEEQQEMEDGVASATKDAPAATPLRSRLSTGSSSPRPHSPATPRASGVASPGHRAPSSGSKLVKTLTNISDDMATTSGTASKYALMRWPRIVEIIDISGTERGAFEAGRVRIITSRRLSSKAGAERRVIVGTERPGEEGGPPTMKLVPLGGEWDTQGKQAGLHTTAKNPMSLALDHDKLVYGCTDGSIVVAGFVGATGAAADKPVAKTRREPPRA